MNKTQENPDEFIFEDVKMIHWENMNVEYNAIAIDDIKDLIEGLYRQSNEFLKRVQEFKDSADGVA